MPVALAPSPNSHSKVSASPSGSLERDPSNWISVEPASPEYGPPASAIGGLLAGAAGSGSSATFGGVPAELLQPAFCVSHQPGCVLALISTRLVLPSPSESAFSTARAAATKP